MGEEAGDPPWWILMVLSEGLDEDGAPKPDVYKYSSQDPLTFADLLRSGKVPRSASAVTTAPEPPPPAEPAVAPPAAPPGRDPPISRGATLPSLPPAAGSRSLPRYRGTAIAGVLDAARRPAPAPETFARRLERSGLGGEIERRFRAAGDSAVMAGLLRTKEVLALPRFTKTAAAAAAAKQRREAKASAKPPAAKKQRRPPKPGALQLPCIAMILGPVATERDADVVRNAWGHKSRGVVPRAAWGELVAAWFRLGLYADLATIFGAVQPARYHALLQSHGGELWLVERERADVVSDLLERYERVCRDEMEETY